MSLSSESSARASFNPVFRTQGSGSEENPSTSNTYDSQLDYDDDDEEMLNDCDFVSGSNADSTNIDPSSDPSKFKLEISIEENEAGSNDSSADLLCSQTGSDSTTKAKKEVLALSNETLWDIFDLVFECENYKSTLNSSSSSKKQKIIYSPRFRDEMKHRYNLVRNTIFEKCNSKLNSIFESGAYDNNSYLVATLIPCLSQGTINTINKTDISALVTWLESDITPQVNQFWETVDGEKLEQLETGRTINSSNAYNKNFFTTLNKEISFVKAINQGIDERKKLMDGIVVDLASLVSIGSGANQNSSESPMATMGPLLAAKMVADTLPIARISKFIPHLARYSYAQKIVQINEMIVNEVKDVIVDNFSLNSTDEKALYLAQDIESVLDVFKQKNLPATTIQHSLAPKTPNSSKPDDKDYKMNNSGVQTKTEPAASARLQEDLSSSPPLSGSSAVASHSIAFFPNNHRKTASISSVPNGQFPLGVRMTSAAAPPSGFKTPTTPLPLSLFPAAGIHSSSSSSASSTSAALSQVSSLGSTSSPESLDSDGGIDKKKLVGPLLAPLLALNVISPTLENIYPDYLVFLHNVFNAWTNISNLTTPMAGMVGFNALGGSSSPPAARSPFVISENVKVQTALGGIYLTLINHSTTQKIPAINRCFTIMQNQLQSQSHSRAHMKDLDTLKSKLVEVYNDWVASQPPPKLVPLSERRSLANKAAETSSTSARAPSASATRKAALNAKQGAIGNKKLVSASGSRISKSGGVQKNSQRVSNASVGDFPLPLNGEGLISSNSNRFKHSRNQSTSSNSSEAIKTTGTLSSLPSPCSKCYHNHKGNNCARKCYVCRMAKLAAQHGHIVELKPASAPTATSASSNPPSPGPVSSSRDIASSDSNARSQNDSHESDSNYSNNSDQDYNRNYNSNSRFMNDNRRSTGIKSRNENYSRQSDSNYGNSDGSRNSHSRAMSYGSNGYSNPNRRRTNTYSHRNDSPYHNPNGPSNYHHGGSHKQYDHNGLSMSYRHNNDDYSENGHRNGHRRNPSTPAGKFAMRLGSQRQDD